MLFQYFEILFWVMKPRDMTTVFYLKYGSFGIISVDYKIFTAFIDVFISIYNSCFVRQVILRF